MRVGGWWWCRVGRRLWVGGWWWCRVGRRLWVGGWWWCRVGGRLWVGGWWWCRVGGRLWVGGWWWCRVGGRLWVGGWWWCRVGGRLWVGGWWWCRVGGRLRVGGWWWCRVGGRLRVGGWWWCRVGGRLRVGGWWWCRVGGRLRAGRCRSDAGGGPDAAPTRGIASKRFENFIPCLVPAPRSSCFSLFVAGERRSPVCCQEPSVRARRCMSVCTALVTPRTGPLTVVLPCPEESMPTSACAAALLESAWATAIAAQALPINRQAATMQTPAAKRKRAAITIRPHQKPLPAKPLPYCGIFHRICGLQGRPRARRSPATHHLRHVEAQFTRSGSTTAFLPTSPISRGLATSSNALPVHWAAQTSW